MSRRRELIQAGVIVAFAVAVIATWLLYSETRHDRKLRDMERRTDSVVKLIEQGR